MKILICFLMALVPFLSPMQALAKTLTCQPDPHEAQFMISWNDKEVSLRVINPTGYSTMPQMENAGESSIPFLKMQSDDLRGLGDSFEYHWAKENCNFDTNDEWLITCNGSVKAVNQANKVSALGFTTSKMEEKSLRSSQSTFRTRVTFENNNIYFVSIPSALNFCIIAQ